MENLPCVKVTKVVKQFLKLSMRVMRKIRTIPYYELTIQNGFNNCWLGKTCKIYKISL